MSHAFSYLKVAASALLLAATASSTAGIRADTPSPQPQSQAGAYSVLTTLVAHPTQPAVEHLPKSQIAWSFSTLPDGTKVISGPNGTIWRGRIEAGMGPISPPSAGPNYNYHLYVFPKGGGQPRTFEFTPPSQKSLPSAPNLSPILPPGQSQRHDILPKLTP